MKHMFQNNNNYFLHEFWVVQTLDIRTKASELVDLSVILELLQLLTN